MGPDALLSRTPVEGRRAGRRTTGVSAAVLLLAALAVRAQSPVDLPRQQVFAVERAFAKTMADRDVVAFARFIAEDAIFFDGSTALRGKARVVAEWSRFFTDKVAPFSWEPDQVEVLDSGTLALSTGLVRDREGRVVARFNSIWRLEAPGVWRIVFDKGSPPTAAEKSSATSSSSSPARPDPASLDAP